MIKIFLKRLPQSCLAAFAALAVLCNANAGHASGDGPGAARQHWTFGGMTGYFDRAQLRRGYLVYKNVCSACHGMHLLYYRNLSEPGGPEFSEERVKEIAAETEVTDGPNDEGEMFTRPGLPSDRFVSPYPNDKAAAAAQGGSVPPDLSVITNARAVTSSEAWYLEPFRWLYEIVTVYQEQGSDYLFALLTGFEEAPAGVEIAESMYYNRAFPGHQISMAPPLSEDIVEYEDGTPGTVENYARDVTAFLSWAADPKLEERKSMGLKVLIYLAILSLLLYLSKRVLWRNVEH